ncbi:MAG: ATP-binding cassette domain-containing protein [Acidobacteria bacterium]|nr:ATP-binding cassette domain-containing protein [Acidobacteriota bacterium]
MTDKLLNQEENGIFSIFNFGIEVMLKARIKMKLGPDRGHPFTLDVDIEGGNGITVLFGTSGAGKTSILRAVSGIYTPDEGRISLGNRVYFDSSTGERLPIQQRRIGYVFQNHLLFPHFTAEQNVLYAIRDLSRARARQRARELLSMLGIGKTARQYPRELSGGEQQRVALARALAQDPSIMLLDEPLSSVDAATRSRLLDEICAAQKRSGIPFLYVTHNHSEAVRLGDAMLVLDQGRVVQTGTPLEIFNSPRSAPVARVVGTENIFIGEIVEHRIGDGTSLVDINSCRVQIPYSEQPLGSRVSVGIRSEDILVSREYLTQTSARNVLKGVIRRIILDADKAELVVSSGVDFKVSITPATIRILDLEVGTEIYMLIKARAIHQLV